MSTKIETLNRTRNSVLLLRLPFSVFLLPVSLFSFYYIHPNIDIEFILLLLIWHFLVFPSSNGYNSYHDKDEGPIGVIAAPPLPTKMLLHIVNFMDVLAILLTLLINLWFTFFVVIYILFSRLYSNRKVRLKQFPVIGFFVVVIMQGALVFCANIMALANVNLLKEPAVIYSAVACSLFIATIYPLTQIYQHKADADDGVKTISLLLGKNGTFLFSGFMFALSTLFIFFSFNQTTNNFWLFLIVMFPATLYFIRWAFKSFKNPIHVNFKNTMTMLVLSSILNNLYFFILLIKQ